MAAPQQSGSEAAKKTSTRRKKKTFFDVAKFLPDWGVGSKLAKTHWDPNCFYKITRVNLYKDGRHGKAWGVFHKYAGVPCTEAPCKIGGVNKHLWRYIKDPPEKIPESEVKSTIVI